MTTSNEPRPLTQAEARQVAAEVLDSLAYNERRLKAALPLILPKYGHRRVVAMASASYLHTAHKWLARALVGWAPVHRGAVPTEETADEAGQE